MASTSDEILAHEVGSLLSLLSLQNSPLRESRPLLGNKGAKRRVQTSVEILRLCFDKDTSTLCLTVFPEPGINCKDLHSGQDVQRLHLLLAEPIQVQIFFPANPSDPPLCFGMSEAAARVAERVNQVIVPLERSSLLHTVSLITSTIRQEVDLVWPEQAATHWRCAFASSLAARLSSASARRAADLLLTLLSMSKPHTSAVLSPLPRFFYREALIEQQALNAALASIPPLASLADPQSQAARSLPLPACVLLHHLLFRQRVSLAEADLQGDPALAGLLESVMALPEGQRPAMIAKVEDAPDARFAALAAEHGTRVGFHGSPPENFFSIVCVGLKNLSGTKGMRNGAAFGEGVYLAASLGVARNFSNWGAKVWAHTGFAAQGGCFGYQLVALCEFVDMPGYTRPGAGGKQGSEYFVVEDDAHLAVRALLLFKDPAARWQEGSATPVPRAGPAKAAPVRAGNGSRAPSPVGVRQGASTQVGPPLWVYVVVVAVVVGVIFAV